jgi:hypothetical protein
MTAPLASLCVHSDAGFDGGNWRQPARPKAKVDQAETIRKSRTRIASHDTAASAAFGGRKREQLPLLQLVFRMESAVTNGNRTP